jgi:hypothetical protein
MAYRFTQHNTVKHNYSWIIIDNYFVRTLLGEPGLQIPPGQVTDQHVQEVITKLHAFDIVMLLEELDDPGPAMLNSTLGWTKMPAPQNQNHGNHRDGQQVSDEDIAFITTSTRMDQMLYEYWKNIPVEERGMTSNTYD